MLSCSIWFSAPSFWIGVGLESRCVGCVYGADGAPCTANMSRRDASTSMLTELVGWVSKSSTFSQTKFVTLEPESGNFFTDVGRFQHYMVQQRSRRLLCEL